jgi:TolA-binding protein
MKPCLRDSSFLPCYSHQEDLIVRRFVLAVTVVMLAVYPATAQNKKSKDSPAVASARKKLETKVTVDFKETPISEVAEEIKKQVEDLSIWLDSQGGVSRNQTITYKAEDKPLVEAFDEMFKKTGLGYVIGKKKDKRYEGWIIIKKGNFRGDEEDEKVAEEPTPKRPTKTKPKKEEDAEEAKPEAKSEEKPDKTEEEAARKLKFAKMFERDGLLDKAKEKYKEIVKKYPDTKAAKDAKKLLEKLSP